MKKEFHTVKHALAPPLSSPLLQQEGGFMRPWNKEREDKISFFFPDGSLIIFIDPQKCLIWHASSKSW